MVLRLWELERRLGLRSERDPVRRGELLGRAYNRNYLLPGALEVIRARRIHGARGTLLFT
jgi:hypothetical protein